MQSGKEGSVMRKMMKAYPEKFLPEDQILSQVQPGDRIFIGTACGEPQYLVEALARYVESHPGTFSDAEALHIWTLGVDPVASEKLGSNFRRNSFFIGNNIRRAVNEGTANYIPIFLSQVPDLLKRHVVPIDIALIQTSPPDEHGYMSLGISVDMVKAAAQLASLVIAQVNSNMPRVHGDSFLHISEVDFLLPHDEPLLEYETDLPDETVRRMGKYVSNVVEDGDTVQVGYGSIPSAVISCLAVKHDLGVHTELLTDGVVDLMRKGVVNNRRKNIDTGKTVAAFCMGMKETYAYINDNPTFEFKTIDYTNSPSVISRINNMTAVNTALEIDLTGQATSESLGRTFYSGIGGQADFMRGAVMAPGGKSILVLPSTAQNGAVSRIVPFLKEGAGVTLTRGDIHYVITEYGIAYLHGRNFRERAMSLISIAHPRFQQELLEEANRQNLISKGQAYVPGKRGVYPEHLETRRKAKTDLEILLRPVKKTDEALLEDFFSTLEGPCRSLLTVNSDSGGSIPIDYTGELLMLALLKKDEKETLLGVGKYTISDNQHAAEVAVLVRESHRNLGIGTEILSYLKQIARRRGLLGFTAKVERENESALRLFKKMDFDLKRRPIQADYYLLDMHFKP